MTSSFTHQKLRFPCIVNYVVVRDDLNLDTLRAVVSYVYVNKKLSTITKLNF